MLIALNRVFLVNKTGLFMADRPRLQIFRGFHFPAAVSLLGALGGGAFSFIHRSGIPFGKKKESPSEIERLSDRWLRRPQSYRRWWRGLSTSTTTATKKGHLFYRKYHIARGPHLPEGSEERYQDHFKVDLLSQIVLDTLIRILSIRTSITTARKSITTWRRATPSRSCSR